MCQDSSLLTVLIAGIPKQVSRTLRIVPLFLTLVSVLPANTLVFTNRAEWENAAGNLTTLSFSPGLANTAAGITSEGVNFVGRLWGSHIIGDFRGDPFGENPTSEVNVDGYRLFSDGTDLRVLAEYRNSSRVALCSQFPCPYEFMNFRQAIDVNFPGWAFAFGADFTSFFQDTGFLSNPVQGISNQPTVSGQTVFWGIVSTEPLTSLTVAPNLSSMRMFNADFSGTNTLRLTNISVTPTPEPESYAVLLLVGLGFVAAGSRRRVKRARAVSNSR